MAGYGKIIAGQRAKSFARKTEASARGIMGDYETARAGIRAFSEGVNVLGQAATSLYKGYAEGQSKWENIEAGAKEYGDDALSDVTAKREKGSFGNFFKSLKPGGESPKEGFKNTYESLFGPSEKTLKDSMIKGDGYEMSFAEAGTLGKTITQGGRRFAKTYDPETKEYKSIQESGWGEKTKGLVEGESLEDNTGEGVGAPYMQGSDGSALTPIEKDGSGVEALNAGVDANYGKGTTGHEEVKPPQVATPEDSKADVPPGKTIITNSKGQKYYLDDNGKAVIVANVNTGATYGGFA